MIILQNGLHTSKKCVLQGKKLMTTVILQPGYDPCIRDATDYTRLRQH